jgi:hypothetical protein
MLLSPVLHIGIGTKQVGNTDCAASMVELLTMVATTYNTTYIPYCNGGCPLKRSVYVLISEQHKSICSTTMDRWAGRHAGPWTATL